MSLRSLLRRGRPGVGAVLALSFLALFAVGCSSDVPTESELSDRIGESMTDVRSGLVESGASEAEADAAIDAYAECVIDAIGGDDDQMRAVAEADTDNRLDVVARFAADCQSAITDAVATEGG